MRNIKTTLRLVRNSALLFVAASGVTYLTGCQSESGLNPDNNVPEPSLSTASYTVHGANQNRVHNYGSSSTRAGEYVKATDSFTMPECPEIPSDAKDLNGSFYNYGSPNAGSYYIKAGDTLNGGLDCKNGHVDLYVAGTWNVGDYIKGDLTVYILTGGKVNFTHNNTTVEPNVTIYNYGDIVAPALVISHDAKLYSEVDITECPTVGVNDAEEGIEPGQLYCKGTIQADKEVRLNGTAVACAFTSGTHIVFNNKASVRTSYLKAPAIELNASGVVLDNNGLIDATEKLICTNDESRFTVNGTNAVVYAPKFITNNTTWPKKMFSKELALAFGECYTGGGYYNDGNKTPINDFEWQQSVGSQKIQVPAAGCHGSFRYDPDEDTYVRDEDPAPTPSDSEDPEGPTETEPIVTPELVKIVDIESLDEEVHKGNHDHGVISATCINFGPDGTAYASYHLRGNGDGSKNPNYVNEYAQKGCIEVIKNNEAGEFALGSYMIAPDYDFNHVIIDGDNIITVGNAKKKGAFIASLPKGFEAAEGVNDNLKVKELTTNVPLMGTSDKTGKQIKVGYTNAGDGNCVVRQGDYYYVATYEGYGPLNTDFSRVKDNNGNVVFTKTNGSAKHISIKGGNMAVIALDSYDKTSSTASVKKFGASDYSFSSVLASYDAVGTVSPVDGKNVVAVDGDNIYACLSKGGLVRVNDGKKWQRGENGNVPVNGMAFDDEYIYVANGSFVSVLDKATMEEVCYYHAMSQKSANYIAVNNGKIYVAFGEDGIRVFQLVKKEISQE